MRQAIADLQASQIREVANAGLGRTDVLAFWFGESDEVTPDFIRQAAIDSLQSGETFYSHNLGLPVLREALRAGWLPLVWASARFLADAPEGEKSGIASGIEHGYIGDDPAGAQTVSELLIASPYFIPDAHGIAHLTQMSRRGVRVAVLTNSLASTDSVAAHAGYAGRRAELLSAGVELHEFKPQNGMQHRWRHRWGRASPASLHTKLVVQDRTRVVIGSLNQDPRSRLHNTESWLMIESRELAAELADHFEEGIDLHHSFRVEYGSNAAGGDSLSWLSSEQGLIVRHDSEPMTDVWLLLWRATLRWLVPEHLL